MTQREFLPGDAGVQATLIDYPSDGIMVPAYECRPTKPGRFPGIIVIQEWWGLNAHIQDVAQRLCREGYITLAPNLYSRIGSIVTQDPEEAGRLMEGLKDSHALQDLVAGVRYLKTLAELTGRVGCVGFCMGGTYALHLTAESPDLAAAVAFYGQIVYETSTAAKPRSPLTRVPEFHSPVQYHWAAEDHRIVRDHFDQLTAALTTHGKPHEAYVYAHAPHAFFNDRRPTYRPEAAKEAWSRALAFFGKHLAGGRA